ncbi:hypothetical protein DPMN_097166 [Dreissena polymorpha]|uniref:Uncharacterized protein n=1 Tax=Dreissena polymorpha TaxID=45954 RepID=A0A9D4LCR8_DREPO|nr:hypothetical protein DPMN_097166 [Dreissena polymorpha]
MARPMEIAERQSKAMRNNESQNHDNVNKLRFTLRNHSTQSWYMSRAKSNQDARTENINSTAFAETVEVNIHINRSALLKERNVDIAINLITSKLCAEN